MPHLNILMTSGPSAAQKTELLKKACAAAAESLAAPVASIRITVQEIDASEVIIGGEIGKDMILFNVQMIVGRSDEKKAALIASLNKVAHDSLGISDQDVRVIIRDVATTDMGMAGGITAKAAGR